MKLSSDFQAKRQSCSSPGSLRTYASGCLKRTRRVTRDSRFARPLPWILIWLSLGYVSGGELTIEVPFGPCLDQANHVHAYETIIVQVDPVDGESDTEAPLGNAWRVKFDVDPATVQKLSWRIEPNSTHEFVLWPLEKKGPFPTKYTGFTLHTLRDVHLKQRDHALKPIVEQADLAKAKEKFTKLAPLYARVPKTKLRDGSSAAEFKHVLLRVFLAEAAKY